MTTAADAWTPPAVWSVPRAWAGERCYVLCGGASLTAQTPLLSKLRGRIVAVKQAALLRPDADVLFIGGEQAWDICRPVFNAFYGRYIVARGKSDPRFPLGTKRVARSTERAFSTDPRKVGGRDSGTSAINLACLFGASEIILLGFDMRGGHWDPKHPVPFPPPSHFKRHLEILPAFAADAAAAGHRIVNCSPKTAVTCFERQRLEDWL